MDYIFHSNDPEEDSTYHYRGSEVDFWSQLDEHPPKKPEKKQKGWSSRQVIALCLCASLFAGILGAGGAVAFHLLSREDPQLVQSPSETATILEGFREQAIIDIHQVDTSRQMTPAEVYAANVRSTVGITTSVTTNYWGYQTTSAASGSGFILTSDGYILTNYHVIEHSSSITITSYDGDVYEAELVGFDESNDIAVLKADAKDLSPVILGSSDNLNVGDSVLAIGNPLGELTFSLTAGTVSALNRQVTMSSGVTMQLIQTDCAINSGNSGGALFNLYGEVVGITNAKYSSSSSGASIDNIGFAIPIDDVRGIVESIIENGYISKPYIGISVVDVSAETQSYGLPQGAAVKDVTVGSPAEEAGLQISDIITEVNDEQITSSSQLVARISKSKPGDKLRLTVYRRGSFLNVTISVGERIFSATKSAADPHQPN